MIIPHALIYKTNTPSIPGFPPIFSKSFPFLPIKAIFEKLRPCFMKDGSYKFRFSLRDFQIFHNSKKEIIRNLSSFFIFLKIFGFLLTLFSWKSVIFSLDIILWDSNGLSTFQDFLLSQTVTINWKRNSSHKPIYGLLCLKLLEKYK